MSRSFFPSFFSPLLQARITLALLACVLLALTSSSGYAQQNKAVKPLTPKAQYQQLTTEGNALRVNKQYPEARAKFTEAAALMPTLPAPWEEIGVCYEQEQNPDEAQKAHVKALELDATYKPAVNSLLRFAQTYNSTNRPLEALALLEMLYTKTSGANQLRPAEEFLITLSKMGNYPRIVQETPKVLKLLIEQGKETKAAAVRQAGKTFDAITRAWDATGVLNAKIIESDGLYRGKSVDSPQSVVLSNLLLAAARIEKGKSGTANALDYLTRAIALMPDNIESYREKTDLLQKVKGKDEALVFVKLALEKFPKDEPLLSKEGEYYTQRNEFRPALEVYQKLQELQPQNNWYLRRLIDTQLSLNMQKEAKQTFQKAIDRINADPSSSAESKKQQVEYLRKTFQDKLDLVSLNQDQVQSVQQDLTAHPQDPMAWRRLGDFYLDQSDQQLALSAYLQAAYLAKDPANFISKTFEIVANPRKAEPMPYLIALVEHFPSNTENFRAIQEIINQQRIKPDKRFALTPEQTEGFRIAEKACLLIAKQPDISNDMRLQAQFCAIKYHNEPLSNEPEIWKSAVEQTTALLKDASLSLQREIREYNVDILLNRLNDQPATFVIYADLLKTFPQTWYAKSLVDTALRMRPLPDPAPLVDYLRANPNEVKNIQLQKGLGYWYWELGKTSESLQIFRPLLMQSGQLGFPWSAPWAPQNSAEIIALREEIKTQHPQLFAQLGLVKTPDTVIPTDCQIVLTNEKKITRYPTSGANSKDSVIVTEQARLTIPAPLALAGVRLNSNAPVSTLSPPAFLHSTSGTWTAVWRSLNPFWLDANQNDWSISLQTLSRPANFADPLSSGQSETSCAMEHIANTWVLRDPVHGFSFEITPPADFPTSSTLSGRIVQRTQYIQEGSAR